MKYIVTISLLGGLLGACTDTGGTGVSARDPYEAQNRAVHEFNRSLDKNVLRPVSQGYGKTVPEPVRESVSNAVSNLELPGVFINHILQGDGEDAAETFVRFAMNSSFGLAGLRDPAADAGVFARDTDFGETMGVWGVRQGAYVELPFFGASSERDFAGRIVDYAIDPVSNLLESPAAEYRAAGTVVDIVNQRYEFTGVIDTLLYESADSYTAQRIAYLQNKSQSISGGVTEEDLEDPYAFE